MCYSRRSGTESSTSRFWRCTPVRPRRANEYCNPCDAIHEGRRIENGAWTYYETTPVCDRIKDAIAFYPEKVDAIDIG